MNLVVQEAIANAALQLVEISTHSYPEAKSYIHLFLGFPESDSYQIIKMEGEEATVIQWHILYQRLNFVKAIEVCIEAASVITSPLVLKILGGMLFIKNIMKLKRLKLCEVDSLIILALYKNDINWCLTEDECLNAYSQLECSKDIVRPTLSQDDIIEHLTALEKLNCVKKHANNKWAINDDLKFV